MREIYHCLLPGGIISSFTCTAHSSGRPENSPVLGSQQSSPILPASRSSTPRKPGVLGPAGLSPTKTAMVVGAPRSYRALKASATEKAPVNPLHSLSTLSMLSPRPGPYLDLGHLQGSHVRDGLDAGIGHALAHLGWGRGRHLNGGLWRQTRSSGCAGQQSRAPASLCSSHPRSIDYRWSDHSQASGHPPTTSHCRVPLHMCDPDFDS